MKIVKAKKEHLDLIDPVEDGVKVSDTILEYPAYSLIDGDNVYVTAGIYLGEDDRYYAWAVVDKNAKRLSTFIAIKDMMEAIIMDLDIDELYATVKKDFPHGSRLVEHLGFEMALSTNDEVHLYRKVV